MTIQDQRFSAVMMLAETIADFTLLLDFCLFTSALALAAPLSAVASVPDAGRSLINRINGVHTAR
jgi:hypothetical protein